MKENFANRISRFGADTETGMLTQYAELVSEHCALVLRVDSETDPKLKVRITRINADSAALNLLPFALSASGDPDDPDDPDDIGLTTLKGSDLNLPADTAGGTAGAFGYMVHAVEETGLQFDCTQRS